MRILYMLPIALLALNDSLAHAGEKVLIGTPVAKSRKPANQQWYYPFEVRQLNIKQSSDGTGIIKDVTCPGCEYRFVKINADTKVIVNGEKVNVLRARERAGRHAYIEFDSETAEVKYIYWSE